MLYFYIMFLCLIFCSFLKFFCECLFIILGINFEEIDIEKNVIILY